MDRVKKRKGGSEGEGVCVRQTRVDLLSWFDENGLRINFELFDLAIPVVRPRKVALSERRADHYITNERQILTRFTLK